MEMCVIIILPEIQSTIRIVQYVTKVQKILDLEIVLIRWLDIMISMFAIIGFVHDVLIGMNLHIVQDVEGI
jgi:hypothetical protein